MLDRNARASAIGSDRPPALRRKSLGANSMKNGRRARRGPLGALGGRRRANSLVRMNEEGHRPHAFDGSRNIPLCGLPFRGVRCPVWRDPASCKSGPGHGPNSGAGFQRLGPWRPGRISM